MEAKREIMARCADGILQKDIAAVYRVSPSCVSKMVRSAEKAARARGTGGTITQRCHPPKPGDKDAKALKKMAEKSPFCTAQSYLTELLGKKQEEDQSVDSPEVPQEDGRAVSDRCPKAPPDEAASETAPRMGTSASDLDRGGLDEDPVLGRNIDRDHGEQPPEGLLPHTTAETPSSLHFGDSQASRKDHGLGLLGQRTSRASASCHRNH